jgi:hypothetical protein
LLLVVPKRDLRSNGMKYEADVRCGGTNLETAQNSFGVPTAKKKPDPEW